VSTLTAAEIRAAFGIEPGTLRVWVHRRHIRKVGRDTYDRDSVLARCAAQTREEGRPG
jgi:hypothetical protein